MRPGAGLALLWFVVACGPRPPQGPQRLLMLPTAGGAPARASAFASRGETRPALVESARYRVRLPRRPLLTFGLGLATASAAKGRYRFRLTAGGRTLADEALTPANTQGWRDMSLRLDGLGSETTLAFELESVDGAGRVVEHPRGVVAGVADPTLHDLDDYGGTRGIVLISIDTLRQDHVGAYGYAKPTTPRIDALARAGILCEDAVSTSSWTLPAHLSLMTSVDPALHGGIDLRHGFNRSVPTLAALLKGAGFATEAVTNHLYVSATYGFGDGFEQLDYKFDRPAMVTARIANSALDRVGDRPFFLFVHFFDPHWPYSPHAVVQRLFEPPPRAAGAASVRDLRGRDRSNTPPADLAAILARYDGEIRHTDDAIGRMLDHMKARGLDRSTLVVVTSDHGEEFLEHGSWEHQKTLYEELIRIPLVFQGPGVAPRREAAQVSLLDVMPTILGWVGVPVPERTMGRSLLETPAEREAYGETDQAQDGTRKLFLRGGRKRWKAVFSLAHDAAHAPREEWYDLGSDPHETHGARPPATVAEDMRRRALERWRSARSPAAGAPPAVVLTPEERERLRALGYVGP